MLLTKTALSCHASASVDRWVRRTCAGPRARCPLRLPSAETAPPPRASLIQPTTTPIHRPMALFSRKRKPDAAADGTETSELAKGKGLKRPASECVLPQTPLLSLAPRSRPAAAAAVPSRVGHVGCLVLSAPHG